MKISIVIPNWNGTDKLKKNLPEVLEVAKANSIEEVIVSDDASTDNSVEILKNDFSQVKVIEKKQNSGFASNVDLGVSEATGDLIFLLNNDAIPTKDFLKFVLPHFENPKVFSVGCNVGGSWATAKFENGFFWHNQAEDEKPDKDTPHQTLWASGGSAIFRKSIWDELGGLDSLFDPFYEEDTDLGYRATKRGYINIWEPRSMVKHYHEVGVIAANFSKEKITKTAQRNHLIFIWKNITSEKLLNEHINALIKMLILHPRYWLIFLSAVKKLPEILNKRIIEKRYAKLTDEEIFNIFSQS